MAPDLLSALPTALTELLTGWGRTAPTAASVVPVATDADVGSALAAAGARGVTPRGLGRSYGDAAQNAGGTVLEMSGLASRCELDTARRVVTAAAGITLDDVMRRMVPRGWFVPVTPGTRAVTVGGAVAADIHGKNHHVDGSFGRHVQSLVLRTGGGEERTLTPASTPDELAATVGGMGLTGVITEVTFTVVPVETSRMRVDTERADDLDDCMDRMSSGDAEYRYSVAWIDLLARGSAMGRSVLTRGHHATVDELPRRARREPLDYAPRVPLVVPPWMPSGLLRRPTVMAFNEVWFRKAPKEERGAITSIPSFFHPLDFVRDWNRIYGRTGLLQYQFVVPFGAEETLREVVGRLSAVGCPSFLAVLKPFGPGNPMLSFPMPGWTLALDVPAGIPGLASLLDGLDALVAGAGGRVYLAKDSRMGPGWLPRMYPELDRWREVADKLDPERLMTSDLDRRLHVRSGA